MAFIPRRVDVAIGYISQFGNEVAHVISAGVEFLSLQHRIDHPEERGGVSATACDPLPARGIVGEVRVNQCVPEPLLAKAPVDQQMFDQEARGGGMARQARTNGV